jgi:hypothetical protein
MAVSLFSISNMLMQLMVCAYQDTEELKTETKKIVERENKQQRK